MQTQHSNKYNYVSFSTPQLTADLSKLIESANNWNFVRGKVIKNFNFDKWLNNARDNHVFDSFDIPREDIETANTVLKILLLEKYCKGPTKYILDHKDEFIKKILLSIEKKQPIEVVVPSFPGRPLNPLTRTRPQPDLGEVASFTRLGLMAEHVKTVYTPGLKFNIVLDGRAYAPFYGYTPESVRFYPKDLRKLIDQLGVGKYVELIDMQGLVDERLNEFNSIYPYVVEELEEQWEDPNYTFHTELIDAMKLGSNSAPVNAAAVKLLKYYDDRISVDKQITALRDAVNQLAKNTAFSYMCFLVTIRKMNLIKDEFPHAIRGTVHPKDGQYSPHLVNEHTSIVPWHGIAVLRKNGRVDSIYESYILEEPEKYIAVYLEGEYTPFYYEEVE